MRIRNICLALTAALVLFGCSSDSTTFLQPYSENQEANDIKADVSRDKRLESYAKDQVILLDNDSYPLENITANEALLFKLDDDNTVILCKNAYESFQPGNITKLIAGEYILSNYDYYSEVMIDSEIFSVDQQLWSCHFTKGDSVKMKDLIYAAVMYGANDVLIPLGKYTAGDVNYLAGELNKYMSSLGAENTNIISCFGTDVSGQKTTIFDLYLFFSKALKDNNLMEMLSTSKYSCQYSNGDAKLGIVFTNYLPYFCNGIESSSGLKVIGGVCEAESVNPTQMLTIVEDQDGNRYAAFVAGCSDYNDCLQQTEEILSRIVN